MRGVRKNSTLTVTTGDIQRMILALGIDVSVETIRYWDKLDRIPGKLKTGLVRVRRYSRPIIEKWIELGLPVSP